MLAHQPEPPLGLATRPGTRLSGSTGAPRVGYVLELKCRGKEDILKSPNFMDDVLYQHIHSYSFKSSENLRAQPPSVIWETSVNTQ